MRHLRLRLRTSWRRARVSILFLSLWFTAGTAGFHWGNGLGWAHALLSAFYFEVQPGAMAQAYAFWGQTLVFGLCAAVVVRTMAGNVVERSRDMAENEKDHTIVVGYSQLGQRIVDHLMKARERFVVIERDRAKVDDLMRRGEPVVLDDARTRDALPGAGVRSAKRLVIATKCIETALIVVKRARDANPKLEILASCHLDDFTDILQKLGADEVYSASQAAFDELKKRFDSSPA